MAPAYRIESVYSNLGGWFQYIELRENSADGKVTPLAGSVITVRHGDVIKQFVIPNDPPAGFPAGGTLVISNVDDWSDDDSGAGDRPYLPITSCRSDSCRRMAGPST